LTPSRETDGATILVVDDRAPDRELLVYLLDHAGYRVIEAADGAEALRLAQAECPDLVISDVLLPEMDGYEFVRQLRSRPSIAGTTVIFYTAVFNEQEARNLARDLGVTQLLTKPTAPEKILEIVSQMLGVKCIPKSSALPEHFVGKHHQLLVEKLLKQNEALRQSEDLFRLLAENATDMIFRFRLHPSRAWEYVNPAATAILGYSPQDFYEHPELLFDVAHPDSRKELESYINERSIPERMPGRPIQIRLIHKDGSAVWVEISVTSLRDDTGNVVALQGIARNITKHREMLEETRRARDELEKRVEERTAELRKANEMLSSQADLLDLAHDAILVRDPDGKILYWNSGAEETYGWGKDEALGKIAQTLLQTQFPKPLEEIKLDILTGGQWEGELHHVTRDGRRIVVASRWATQRDVTDNPSVILEINRDITEKKRGEEAIESYMARLERSNHDLQEFAYIASHDLQEPLRTVSSFVQLLERRYKGKLDADADEFISYAVEGARRMQSLIKDLLQYSRIGTQGNPFEPTDMETVYNQVISSLKTSIEETGALISHDPLPTLQADPSQLAQLLQNLIGNGLKFRSQENPAIHISAKACTGEWLFSVKDNGIGIDREYSERIFQIFQRLHSKEEYPGTGIGLAICRRIIEQHGGKIWVKSVPGKGATFYFTVPVR